MEILVVVVAGNRKKKDKVAKKKVLELDYLDDWAFLLHAGIFFDV